MCVTCVNVARPSYAEDWTPITTERGVTIYRRTLPGSHLTAMKGTGTVDAPVWKVASILLDTRRAREWVESLKESRVLRRLAPDRYVEYNHVGGPFLMKDRDFVSDVHIIVDPGARTFALAYRPTVDAGAPATHNVRGEILSGLFQATSRTGQADRIDGRGPGRPEGIHSSLDRQFLPKELAASHVRGHPSPGREAGHRDA